MQRGLNLRDSSQVIAAILRYNNSMPYARNVLGWAAAYATGVVPVDLPPLTGPPPPLGDIHLENPEGLGPGLPLNIHGLPSTDPLAQMPLIDLGQSTMPTQQPMWPWQSSAPRAPSCTLICIGPDRPSSRPGRCRQGRPAGGRHDVPGMPAAPPASPRPDRSPDRQARHRLPAGRVPAGSRRRDRPAAPQPGRRRPAAVGAPPAAAPVS
ncbi:putative secreted protein [Mycobacterium xenopi 3993]|nr:putative secreted protein [Mycobacterium xenopi 3993]